MATIGLLQDEVYQPAVPTERQSEISSFIAAEMTRAMNEFLTSPELANRIASNVESVFALSEHAGAPTPPAAATAGAYARALIAATDARDESMASTNYIGNSDYSTNESIHESVGNGGRKSVVANVPRIEGNVRLDGDGEFQTDVDLHALSNTHRLQRSSLGSSTVSFNMEDDVMDRRRKMSFQEITSEEKRSVFQLGAVRRSMRYLNHASILLTEEVMQLSQKFMEVGPNRASMMHLGWASLQGEAGEKTEEKSLRDELFYISPLIGRVADLRGFHVVGWVVQLVAFVGELSFYVLTMSAREHGKWDIVGTTAFLGSLLLCLMNTLYCSKSALKGHTLTLTRDTSIDDASITQTNYLRCKGLDVLAKAQERLVVESGKRDVESAAGLREFKKKAIKKVELEAVTVHLLIGLVPLVWSCVVSVNRNIVRKDYVLAGCAALAVWSRIVYCCCSCHIAFLLRLSQVLSEFEVRRVEADIRTISPSMIHRITPRFKSLLHECHHVGNCAHGIIYFYLPIIALNVMQFVGGIFESNFSDTSNVACVPAWTFANVFQPLLTMLIYVHGYGGLNLAIERDVDQDVVEMNIRLTYSDSHVPNWLLQQMICLERLDGRAFSLPFNVVPSLEMSRQMASTIITAVVFLGPFLISITEKLSQELLCFPEDPSKMLISSSI